VHEYPRGERGEGIVHICQKKESCLCRTFFWGPPPKKQLWPRKEMVPSHTPEKGMLCVQEFFLTSTAKKMLWRPEKMVQCLQGIFPSLRLEKTGGRLVKDWIF